MYIVVHMNLHMNLHRYMCLCMFMSLHASRHGYVAGVACASASVYGCRLMAVYACSGGYVWLVPATGIAAALPLPHAHVPVNEWLSVSMRGPGRITMDVCVCVYVRV